MFICGYLTFHYMDISCELALLTVSALLGCWNGQLAVDARDTYRSTKVNLYTLQ